jgi:hypothetical protein
MSLLTLLKGSGVSYQTLEVDFSYRIRYKAFDNFNRTNGGLGSNWTNILTDTAGGGIFGNAYGHTNASTTDSAWVYTGTSWDSDQESFVTIPTLPTEGTAYFYLLVRISGTSGYLCINAWNGSSWTSYFYRLDSGTATYVATFASGGSITAGDRFSFQVIGNEFKFFMNGGQVGSTYTDSTYTSGSPGIGGAYSNTFRLDDWGGVSYPSSIQTISIDSSWKLFNLIAPDLSWRVQNSISPDFSWRLQNSIAPDFSWRLQNGIGPDFSWKILKQFGPDFSWAIITAVQGSWDFSWRVQNALQRNSSWRILNQFGLPDFSWRVQNAVGPDFSWRVQNSIGPDFSWRVQNSIAPDLSWKIFTQFQRGQSWRIQNAIGPDFSWRVHNAASPDFSWKVLNALSPDLSWKILAGLLSADFSWEIPYRNQFVTLGNNAWKNRDNLHWFGILDLAKLMPDFSWKVFNQFGPDFSWRVQNSVAPDFSWRMFTQSSPDFSWKLFNTKEIDLSWFITNLQMFSRQSSWRICTSNQPDFSWKVQNKIDPDLSWKIFKQGSIDHSWKVHNSIQPDYSWGIQTSTSIDFSWVGYVGAFLRSSWIIQADRPEDCIVVYNADGVTFYVFSKKADLKLLVPALPVQFDYTAKPLEFSPGLIKLTQFNQAAKELDFSVKLGSSTKFNTGV